MEWWTVFLLLLCPLMMLFCMRGHSQGGHKHGDGVNQQEHFGHHHVYGTKEWLHKRELQKLKQKVEQLAEQNKALKKELEKNTGSH